MLAQIKSENNFHYARWGTDPLDFKCLFGIDDLLVGRWAVRCVNENLSKRIPADERKQ